MDTPSNRCHADYTVGWICALPVEMAAAKLLLDEVHPRLPQRATDHNIYTLGSISGHNVVIAGLPLGVYGISSAAIVATQMTTTFPEIRFSLLVGVGGGVPEPGGNDIRFGDVVVSKPTGTFGGVVQYDFGRTLESGRFQRVGALNKPPSILLAAISTLQAEHMAGESRSHAYLNEIMARGPPSHKFSYPGQFSDELFTPTSRHVDARSGSCYSCDKTQLIHRPLRTSTEPHIHYGTIASANQVMRDGLTRDRLARDMDGGILCFEMEAAGLMDNFPCLVIRGIADYADTHKKKQWQPYAAAVATAYAKDLLSVIPLVEARESRGTYTELSALPSPVRYGECHQSRLSDLLDFSDSSLTPRQVQMKEMGEEELLNRVRTLSLDPFGYISWLCVSCTVSAYHITVKSPYDLTWMCCQCGDGPIYIRDCRQECPMCGHRLCW